MATKSFKLQKQAISNKLSNVKPRLKKQFKGSRTKIG